MISSSWMGMALRSPSYSSVSGVPLSQASCIAFPVTCSWNSGYPSYAFGTSPPAEFLILQRGRGFSNALNEECFLNPLQHLLFF